MEFQDYYAVLGVDRSASADEIRKAYRKLALKWHPDRHKGDAAATAEKRFKQISEAYEVLSHEENRKQYDRFGEHWKQGQDFSPPPGAGRGARTMTPEEFAEAFGGSSGFSDFFTSFFGDQYREDFAGGRARHARYRHRGADVRAELPLSISDAVRGGQRRFEIPALIACERCGGVGRIGQHVCPSCVGVGTTRQVRSVDVTIPPGVNDGTTLRLRGLGESGDEGGEAGDMHLTIRLAPDDVYRIRGHDLEVDLPVAPWEAAFGASVDVSTPEGVVTLTVPEGTRAGAKLRLRGRGLGAGGGRRGDLLAIVRLTLPETLTERQRELLRDLAGTTGDAVRGGARTGSAS